MFVHDESQDDIDTFKTKNLTRTTSRDPTPDPSGSNLNAHAGLFNSPMCPPAPENPYQTSRTSSGMFFQQQQQQPQIPVQPTYSQMLFKQPDAKIQSAWLPRSGSADSSASLTSSPTVIQDSSGVSKIETAWRPRQISSESNASDSKEKTHWPQIASSESTASSSRDFVEKKEKTHWPPREVTSGDRDTKKPKETSSLTTNSSSPSTAAASVTSRDTSSGDKKSKDDATSTQSLEEDDDALAALAAQTAALALDF